MRKMGSFILIALICAIAAPSAMATNGDILIGIGTERGMGGAGIGSKGMDAAGSAHMNPASITSFDNAKVGIGATLFLPSTSANATLPPNAATSSKSKATSFVVPTTGFVIPFKERFAVGMAFYGISGMGVDYVNQDVGGTSNFAAQAAPYGNFVGAMDFITTKQLFQFAPSFAYEIIDDKLSVGISPLINYGMIDFGQGLQSSIHVAAKIGVQAHPLSWLSVGLTYKSISPLKYKRVYDFTGDGTKNDLKLYQPQEVGFGVSVRPLEKLLLLVDGKWINWKGADGYKDFDWKDQYMIAFGAQYDVADWVSVRAGYNYASSPVKNHSGFAAGTDMAVHGLGADERTVQGMRFNSGQAGEFAYEAFRVVGFPAIVEHHLTAGATFNLSQKYAISLSYMHAIKNSLNETGTLDGQAISFGSSLSENTVTAMFHMNLGD